ncbi:MAG TPA: glycosyltransferase family 1 protein, partial [Microvirga sp.]|nr:glycosyltransferase family 1 protein [Microvirga sp.]
MTQTVLIDGFNLGLEKGTGIATYARNLSYAAGGLGYRVDVLYGLRTPFTRDPLLQEAYFFNPPAQRPHGRLRLARHRVEQVVRAPFGYPIQEVPLSGQVVSRSFSSRLPHYDRIWNGSDIFGAAHAYFDVTGRLMPVHMPEAPHIAHWTYPIPIRAPGAKNIYTLHDLVPLKLPYTTLDRTRSYHRLIRTIIDHADHIVTVSEQSKRDICDLFKVSEDRVTNASQAVHLPEDQVSKPVDVVRRELEGLFNIGYRDYFLFYGAVEPKKNVGRLIEAYLATNIDTPLFVVGSSAWKSDQELRLLTALDGGTLRGRVRRLDYVPSNILITLIRGAKAVLFPSLYEGFGLPVLEAMTLGTPVLTSKEGSTPEVAGDAGLLVDPYDVAAIAEGIRTLDANPELCADLA